MTPVLGSLTCREEAVLLLLAEGFGEREIAARLGVTVWTVRGHRASARRKLCACTTAQAVAIIVAARARG